MSISCAWTRHWAKRPAGRPTYLVTLPLHLLQLQHDRVHAVLVHFAVLPQGRALQLQVFLPLQVLRATREISTRGRAPTGQGWGWVSSAFLLAGRPELACPSLHHLSFRDPAV